MGITSAVISLPYLIDIAVDHKAVIQFETLTLQQIMQPTTDKSLSTRKPINRHEWNDSITAPLTAFINAENTENAENYKSGFDEALRAEHIEKLKHQIDPLIAEIHQSLQNMEAMNFPEKERYKKVAQLRILELEELKAGILQ
jgi:hypothetical protein